MQWGVEVVEPVVESEDVESEDEGDGQQVMEMLWVVVEKSSVDSDRSSVVSLSVIELAMVVMESELAAMAIISTSCIIASDVFSVVSLSMVVSELKLSKAATRSPEIQASDFLSILRLGKATSMLVVKVVMVDASIKYSSISVIPEIFLYDKDAKCSPPKDLELFWHLFGDSYLLLNFPGGYDWERCFELIDFWPMNGV